MMSHTVFHIHKQGMLSEVYAPAVSFRPDGQISDPHLTSMPGPRAPKQSAEEGNLGMN